MNAKLFHIGELSARTGRGIHAIRWYESQGLIPGVQRDGGGRRLYNERHVSWLELIARLRLTGMSVAQMREYTALVKQGASTLKQQQALLRAHRARVKATVAEWTRALGLLNRKIEFYDEWLATGRRPAKKPEAPSIRRGEAPRAKRRAA
ncbi:MAG: MerR family transcriptional regulator [Sulfurifustaceae bacterium]